MLVALPIMSRRILDAFAGGAAAPVEAAENLEVVAASGSALPGDLAGEWMDVFGDTLVSLYSSTEVGHVSVAAADDLRAALGNDLGNDAAGSCV